MLNTLEVVVGGQYGSEAKGHVVQRLTERAQRGGLTPHVIRVAGPNAGHTGYDREGRAWALRQVPVAAVTDGPAVLGIAAGSEIDLPVLLDEVNRLRDAGLMTGKHLWVHGEATLIEDHHKDVEAGFAMLGAAGAREVHDANGNDLDGESLVNKIGSTGKGIGAARADRLLRGAKRLLDDPEAIKQLNAMGVVVTNRFVETMCGKTLNHVIIEGTQGYGLGLHAGHYPQCTTSDCRAQDFIAMAGVSPWNFLITKIYVVARIYPIRVAGNSGPLRGETTWEELGLPEERTTVTQKVRRVGLEDWDLVANAVHANGGGPTVRLALTMLDQKFPHTANRDLHLLDDDDQWIEIKNYLSSIRVKTGAEIALVTTGPNTVSWWDE